MVNVLERLDFPVQSVHAVVWTYEFQTEILSARVFYMKRGLLLARCQRVDECVFRELRRGVSELDYIRHGIRLGRVSQSRLPHGSSMAKKLASDFVLCAEF